VSELKARQAAAVVLGCTHYPFLSAELATMLDGQVELIDPAALLVTDLAGNLGVTPAPHAPARAEIAVTGAVAAFENAASACLGYAPGTVYGITIDELQIAARRFAADRAAAFAPHTVSPAGAGSMSATGVVP